MPETLLLGTPETRAQLADLQSKLADRVSTMRFARAGISMVLALIASGASGKLFWDAKHFPWAGIAVAALSLGLAFFSVAQYALGRRSLRLELSLLASLMDLRKTLRLDDPAALLPQLQ